MISSCFLCTPSQIYTVKVWLKWIKVLHSSRWKYLQNGSVCTRFLVFLPISLTSLYEKMSKKIVSCQKSKTLFFSISFSDWSHCFTKSCSGGSPRNSQDTSRKRSQRRPPRWSGKYQLSPFSYRKSLDFAKKYFHEKKVWLSSS